jgi:hypothetical protein
MLKEKITRQHTNPLVTAQDFQSWHLLASKALDKQTLFNAHSPKEIGSYSWLDQQMSFDREATYLNDAKPRFYARWKEKHTSDTTTNTEAAYHDLARRWLQTQITFFLTEFGAGKNLQIQPPYYLIVEHDADGMFVSAANTRYFGDVSSRFRDFNSQVGVGLEKIYIGSEVFRESFLGVVISPTEKYQDFGSTTDVINFFAHAFLADTKEAANESLVLGCYLILNEILSNEQRSFIRNALAEMSIEGHISPHEVRSDAWLSSDEESWLPANPNIMVQHPHIGNNNPFDSPAHFMHWLSDTFQERFAITLIKPAEIAMYGYIEWLVQQHMSDAYQFLKTDNKSAYYDLLQLMLFESQAVWKLLSETTSDTIKRNLMVKDLVSKTDAKHFSAWQFQLVDSMTQHLMDIRFGIFAIGGIHPSTGEGLWQFWDPIAQDWFGGDACSTSEKSICRKCGHELKDNKCSKCEKKAESNKIRD